MLKNVICPPVQRNGRILKYSHLLSALERVYLLAKQVSLPPPPYRHLSDLWHAFPPRGGGGYSQKNWVGVCGPLPKNPTLFMTKICDIPYPISDLTKNSKPYL